MWRLARIVLLATTASAVSVSAFSADLPARMEPVAPVAYVPAFSWTGFYLGGELGWIQTNPKYTTGALLLGAPFVVTSGSDKNGLTYGVLAGYNYQVGQLVLGVEGDFQGWTVGKIRYTAITGDFLTAHSKWGGSVRGRLGYAVDHALFYVTGGAAFVSNETSIPTTGITIGSDDTRVGLDGRSRSRLRLHEQLVYWARIPILAVPIQVLCISDTDPESRPRRLQARTEQQSGYGAHRL